MEPNNQVKNATELLAVTKEKGEEEELEQEQ